MLVGGSSGINGAIVCASVFVTDTFFSLTIEYMTSHCMIIIYAGWFPFGQINWLVGVVNV